MKGKLSREQENMEDILTSNVFGLLQYLSPEKGLLPFLGQAQQVDGARPLADLPSSTTAEMKFWPWQEYGECLGCEPDVLLWLVLPDGTRQIVLIESKLWSGKSSYPDPSRPAPVDQLAREWDNLVRLAQVEKAKPVLLYVTADLDCPVASIRESHVEFQQKRTRLAEQFPFSCAWLSWRKLTTLWESPTHKIQEDLALLASRLGLSYYGGITCFGPVADADWCFGSPAIVFDWAADTLAGDWRFAR
ncbi:MAG TPA: hypothetical protein PKG77_19475 [Phycisphaerae bacterium]|nr:hypothetical protein [Phycisphaerae bacterium]